MSVLRTDILTRRAEIEQWIAEGRSKAFICGQLKCKPITLERYLSLMAIEYQGNQPGRGRIAHNRSHVSVYLRQGSTITSHALRQKLIRDGVKLARCERCGLEMWLEQPIPLELHHIDGDRTNNELSNLELLCPNCHAMCDNNSGRATSKEKAQVAQRQRQCA